MSIFVEQRGILDTFQDLGRTGYKKFGVNPNGAMDQLSLRVNNILLNNASTEPALEMHFPAPVLNFRSRVDFAITGSDFGATLDGETVPHSTVVSSKKGSVLRFKKRISGNRCYLGVRNGFKLEQWLGSGSTNLAASSGGFKGRSLDAGDSVDFKRTEYRKSSGEAAFRTTGSGRSSFRFVPGPSLRSLTALSELELLRSAFKIRRDSDRMGFRLDGSPLYLLENENRLSSAVTAGTIQLLPSGQLILLMADHQTSGGYPNLGTVISADLPYVGQLGPGDTLRFQASTVAAAESALSALTQDLSFLETALRFKNTV